MKFLSNSNGNKILNALIQQIENNDKILILSPYLSDNEAIKKVLEKENFKLSLVINFDADHLLQKSVDLQVLKSLLDKGHLVKFNNHLHSKIYLSSNSVTIGSANFTKSGLEKRQESCVEFSRDENLKVFDDIEKYCQNILDVSIELKISDETFDKLNKYIDDANNLENNYNPSGLSELIKECYKSNESYEEDSDFSEHKKDKSEAITLKAYETKYYYPKTLKELDPDLKYEYIDDEEYERLETEFLIIKLKNERIAFIEEHLFERNKGYMIQRNRKGHVSDVLKWYLDNNKDFGNKLKSYEEFKIDRYKEIIDIYKSKFNIQPKSGDFVRYFDFLKKKMIINEDYFTINFINFSLEKFKDKLEEIHKFISINKKRPAATRRKPNEESSEAKLTDWLRTYRDKYLKGELDFEKKMYLQKFFKVFHEITKNNHFDLENKTNL